MRIELNPTEENPRTLLALAAFFSNLAGKPLASRIEPPVMRADGKLHPDDNPATGTEVELGNVPPPPAFGQHSPVLTPADGATPPPAFGQAGAPAPVPVPPAAALAPTPSGTTLDKDGLPWDHRIHAGTKTQNKDLSWKKKPGVDPALVTQVEAELRALMSIPVGGVPPAPPQPPSAPALTPPPPPPAPAGKSAVELFQQMSGECTGNPTLATGVQQLIAQLGLGSLGGLIARPDLVPQVEQLFMALPRA